MKLRAHFHNTRNTGLANAYAAVEAGVRTLDASCGGIGGCPFAPAATGNIPTEDLIYMLHRMGFDTGVDLPALLETSRWLQTTLDHAVPGMVVKAGLFPATQTDGERVIQTWLRSARLCMLVVVWHWPAAARQPIEDGRRRRTIARR